MSVIAPVPPFAAATADDPAGSTATLGVPPGAASPPSRFEFVRLASLRASQLMRGCTPRVAASYKCTTTARREIVSGKVWGLPRDPQP